MAKPTSNNLRALWATTKEKIAENIKNSCIQNNAILAEVKGSGGLMEVESGGREFNEPAILGDSSAVGGFRRGQPVNVDEQEGIDAFLYSPANFYGTVHMYKTDMALNAGEGRAVSLLKARIEQMKESVNNALDIYLCGSNVDAQGVPTAADTGTQFGWLGLRDLIPDTATQTIPGTGVDKVKYAKARSTVVTTAIASATAWNTNNAGRQVVQSVYNGASFPGTRPNLIVMTRTLWDAFQLSLQANERFTNAGGLDQKVGYPALTYMANCRVTWGDNILAGHFYALNTKFLKVKFLKEANFDMGDFIEDIDVFQEVAKMLVMGQFCMSGPKFNSVYTGAAF
jgi:hypothetical protein